MIDWQLSLIHFLIAKGVNGCKQRDIVIHLGNHVKAPEIVEELESLREQGKVQKFSVSPKKTGGRPATIWRATTKILE